MTAMVYFAGIENGPIKIGTSSAVLKRIAALQTSWPMELKLLATVEGDRKTESYFHSQVAEFRLFGEWFKPEPEVLYLADAVRERGVDIVPEQFRRSVNVPSHIDMDARGNDILAAARQWIVELAEPLPFGEPMHKTLQRVAEKAAVSQRTLKSIWYDETTQMKADVYVGLKDAFDAKMARAFRK